MADREIKITTDRITVQHRQYINFLQISFWSTVFDTNRFYLMTDPAGDLRAGGYERCPTFYGISTDPNVGISDKDNGWWPTDIITGYIGGNGVGHYDANNFNVYLDIPKWDQYKQVVSAPIRSRYFYSPYYNIFNSSNQACGSFRWIAAEVTGGTTTDAYGNVSEYYTLQFWPTEVVLWNQNIDGVIRFPFETALRYFSGPWGTVEQALRYNDGYGTYYWNYPSPSFNNSCLMFLKNPTTLSVAVSP